MLGYAEPNGELFAVAGISRPEGTWFSVAIDSGACENVANPEDVPDYEVTESEASRSGRDFVSATGEVIPNLGELKLPAVTAENTIRGMTFSAAPVTKPLGSVKRICAAGHVVVFDEDVVADEDEEEKTEEEAEVEAVVVFAVDKKVDKSWVNGWFVLDVLS